MRYDYIVAVGVALMAVGGVIVAVGEAKVDVASRRATYTFHATRSSARGLIG